MQQGYFSKKSDYKLDKYILTKMYTNEILTDSYVYDWVSNNLDLLEQHKYLVMWSTRFEPCEAVNFLNTIFGGDEKLSDLSKNKQQICVINSKKIAATFLMKRKEICKQKVLEKDFTEYFERIFLVCRGWSTMLIRIIGESKCRLKIKEYELKKNKITISNTGSVEYFGPIISNGNWIEKRVHVIDKIVFEYECLKKEIFNENENFEIGIHGCQQILE